MAFKAEGNGNLAGRHVGDHLRYDEGVDAGRSLGKQALVQVVEGFHAADARADDRADAVAVFFVQIHLRIFERQFSGRYGVLRRRIHVASFLLIDAESSRVKIFDFAGNARAVFRRVKMSDRTDSIFAAEQRVPKFILTHAYGGNDADACNHYTFFQYFHLIIKNQTVNQSGISSISRLRYANMSFTGRMSWISCILLPENTKPVSTSPCCALVRARIMQYLWLHFFRH